MKIVIRSSAIKDLKSIGEPFKTKIEKKIDFQILQLAILIL